jgi:thioredoxin-like negative regulator of GroEL
VLAGHLVTKNFAGLLMEDIKQFIQTCKSLLESGSYEDVIQVAHDRLESCPDDLEALLFLAESSLLKGDSGEARSMLDRICLRLLPLSRAFKLFGDACYKDNPVMAKDCYRKYIAMNPESEDLMQIQALLDADPAGGSDELNQGFRTLTMASLMVKQGHTDTAMEILAEILSNDPENNQALDMAEKIKVIRELDRWRKNLFLEKSNTRE